MYELKAARLRLAALVYCMCAVQRNRRLVGAILTGAGAHDISETLVATELPEPYRRAVNNKQPFNQEKATSELAVQRRDSFYNTNIPSL